MRVHATADRLPPPAGRFYPTAICTLRQRNRPRASTAHDVRPPQGADRLSSAPSRMEHRKWARASCLGWCRGAWGGNFVVTKVAVTTNGPWIFNALRYATAAALLAAWLCYQKGWRFLLPARGEFGRIVLIGLLQTSLTTSSTNWALTHIDANGTILIAYSMPIWALFFGLVLWRDLVNLQSVISVALGFGGLALFCAPWSMDWTSYDALAGSGAALLGSVGWALGAVLYRRFAWTSSLGQQIFLQVLTAAVTAFLCAAAFEQRALHRDAEPDELRLHRREVSSSD